MIVASLSIQFPIPHRKGEAEAGVMLRVSPQYLLLFFFFKEKSLFIWLHQLLFAACGIEFPNHGLNACTGGGVLAIGPPGKSLLITFFLSEMKKSFSPPDSTIVIRENHLGLWFRQIIDCSPGSYGRFSKINEKINQPNKKPTTI